LRLVRWQNEKEGCTSSQSFTAVGLPRMGGTVAITELLVKSGEITMTATATAPLGSVASARREKIKMYDRKTLLPMTIPESDGDDIFIRLGSVKQGGTPTMEATDNIAHPLIKYSLGKLPDHSRVATAELSLFQSTQGTGQAVRAVALHRLTRDWKDDDATWMFPWTAPGADYAAAAEASTAVAGNGRYAWRIDSLVRRWIAGVVPNYGVLLKPSGLNGARFDSLEQAVVNQRPSLKMQYYLRCA
jgi:hypothetical protein